jgi:hypothetical protein
MREIRTSGSEGGAAQTNASFLPLSQRLDMRDGGGGEALRVVAAFEDGDDFPAAPFSAWATQRRVISAKVSSDQRRPPMGSSMRASKPAEMSRNSGLKASMAGVICSSHAASAVAIGAVGQRDVEVGPLARALAALGGGPVNG